MTTLKTLVEHLVTNQHVYDLHYYSFVELLLMSLFTLCQEQVDYYSE